MIIKKILIVSAVFPPEPVVSAKLSFDLANKISENQELIVISPKPTRPFGFKFTEAPPHLNFKHVVINSYTCPQGNLLGRLKETYSFGKQCYDFISTHHDDISLIYSNTWPLFAQYYTVKAANDFNIPIVIHVQDIYPESLINKFPFGKILFTSILMPIDKFIFKKASTIIAISEKMKNYLVKTRRVSLNKIVVVENWQDEDAFINYTKEPIKQKALHTFMYLGNIGPVAGCDLLIDAFAETKLQNWRLIIAGSGSVKERLEKKASTINNAIIEFWEVKDGEVQRIQDQADVMLIPIKKGAGLSSVPSKLSAYMFSKKPIIACVEADSEAAFAIKNGKCGWVIEPENVKLLSDTMQQIASIPSYDLEVIGNKGFNYAMNHYSKKNNLKKLLKIITSSTKKVPEY